MPLLAYSNSFKTKQKHLCLQGHTLIELFPHLHGSTGPRAYLTFSGNLAPLYLSTLTNVDLGACFHDSPQFLEDWGNAFTCGF